MLVHSRKTESEYRIRPAALSPDESIGFIVLSLNLGA